MRKVALLVYVFLTGFAGGEARAEFIANAFGGEAETTTRAAAARAFEGYQAFYGAMALLERRQASDARPGFQTALSRFQSGQQEYNNAASLLQGRPFDLSKLEPSQMQFLLQFLAPFGVNEKSDQAAVMRAYAATFARTISLIQSDSQMTLARFREIQLFIGRQVLAGTLISQVLRS
jgi:hypothetical protein